MIACYDLARCPPTYDVVSFLMLAELERIRRNEPNLQIHIAPGPKGGFRNDLLWPQSIAERQSLLENIVLPMCWMLPSVSAVVLNAARSEVPPNAFGLNQYLISLPNILMALKGGCRPLRESSVDVADPQSMLVTITLREAVHHPQRNSNVGEWVKAARYIRSKGFHVIFIRDTAEYKKSIPGFSTAPLASYDLRERARLYSMAVLNMGVNNGPMWMAIAMGVPVLMMKPTTEMGGCYDRAYYAGLGLPEGTQLPTSPPDQQLVWQEDTADEIVKAFDRTGDWWEDQAAQ